MGKNSIVCFGKETAGTNATTLKKFVGFISGEDGVPVDCFKTN
jgi:hypothetical protein